MTPRRVRVRPEASFAQVAHPRRARIAGASGPQSERMLAKLERSLAAVSMFPRRDLVFDSDACTLGGRRLETADDWWRVLRTGALGRVEGTFALAWAGSDRTTNIARDPVGHRSLYYALSGDTFVFASTVRAVIDSGAVDRAIQLRSVAAYLSYAYVPGRDTVVEGVYELLPGEIVSFAGGAIERRHFWSLPRDPESYEPEEALTPRLRSTLERCVGDLLPDGPVAASLSGGIDSSLIAALARRASLHRVHTFSITFGADSKDELPWSSLVAEHCDTDHTIVEIGADAVLAHLDDTIARLDKPNGDPLTVPNALLFRTMAGTSDVALNGEGGDPCFGGPKNQPMILSALYGHGDEPEPDEGVDTQGSQERNYLRAHLKAFDDLPLLFTEEASARACAPPLEVDLQPWFSDPRWRGFVSKLMAINIRFKGGHHILPKVDALSAPFGVRARSPLFSKSVVELAFAIPPELKLKGASEKYLLKKAVADLLPSAILERPKSGMLVPVEAWFQGPLLPEARRRILDGLGATGLFRRSYLEKLLAGKVGGLRPRRGAKIWILVTLESHLRSLGLHT